MDGEPGDLAGAGSGRPPGDELSGSGSGSGFHRAVAELAALGLRRVSEDELLEAADQLAARELGVPHAMVFESVGTVEGLRLRCARYRGADLAGELIRQVALPPGNGSLPGYAAQGRVTVVVPDLLGDERFTAVAPSFRLDARAAIAAPIVSDATVWGVLVAYDEHIRVWTDAEQQFMTSLGATLGLVIQRDLADREVADAAARLDLALGAGGLGVWSWTAHDDALELSERAREIYGVPEGVAADHGDYQRQVVHPDDIEQFRKDAMASLRVRGDQHHVFRIIRPADGEVRWIESWGRSVNEPLGPLRVVGVAADITDRMEAEQQREELLANERKARALAEAVREGLVLLGEAGEVLSRSLDPLEVAQGLVSLCVPRLADVCFVDLLDDRGQCIDAASGAADPQMHADVLAIRRARRAAEAEPAVWGQHEAVSGGGSAGVDRIDPQALEAAAADGLPADALRRFGARAVLVVALIARGETIGTLTLMGNGARDSFDEGTRALIEIIAGRAALALDNCRLFTARTRVARALQDALLPPVLPRIPGVEMAARYQVAETDVEIGGDFYDAIEFPGGAWGVVIGDVCGKGPEAAALTGLVRHSVRAAAVREADPTRILAHTNAAVLDQIGEGRFCTAAFVRVEPERRAPDTVTLRVSNAGHPLPLVRRADGSVEVVDCGGSLLGVIGHPKLVERQIELAAGDALVLYTDGVTESRRRGELFGHDRLVERVGRSAASSAEALAADIEAAVAEFRDAADDDLAVVVLLVCAGTD